MSTRRTGQHHRTIVVRHGPGVAEVAQSLRRFAERSGTDGRSGQQFTIAEVDDVYDALAALDELGSDESVTLAIPTTGLDEAPTEIADSARRLAPDVRVVLLAPRGFAASDLSGLDEVVFLPASPADLAAAFAADPVERAADSAEEYSRDSSGDISRDPSSPAPSMRSRHSISTAHAGRSDHAGFIDTPRVPSEPAPARREPDMVELVIDDALQAFAARRSNISAAPVDSGSGEVSERDPAETTSEGCESPTDAHDTIGDIDLADAVTDGGERFITLAAELIRRETGASDVRIVAACNGESDVGASRTDRSEVAVPVRHRRETLGFLVSHDVAADALAPWADWLGHWMRLERAHSELRVLAWTDELTGAGNRRAFERVLEETISAARPERRPVSLMYFDIDNFKSYNDRFGHEAGDEVLRETVELLRNVIRRGDHVFRVGGDEFVVIFADSRGARSGQGPRPGAPGGGSAPGAMESIETIAQRFRDCVNSLRFPQLGLDAPGTVSISAGVATFPWDGLDPRSLLAHADQLALQSKRVGKNTITFGPGAKDHCCDA